MDGISGSTPFDKSALVGVMLILFLRHLSKIFMVWEPNGPVICAYADVAFSLQIGTVVLVAGSRKCVVGDNPVEECCKDLSASSSQWLPDLGWYIISYHTSYSYGRQCFGYSDQRDRFKYRFRAGNWWMRDLSIGNHRKIATLVLKDSWRVSEKLMVGIFNMHHLTDGLSGLVARDSEAVDLIFPFWCVQLVIQIIIMLCLGCGYRPFHY